MSTSGERTDWRQRSACGPLNLHWFFSAHQRDTDRARTLCRGCPVRLDCLDDAIQRGEDFGIFGGLDPSQRRSLVRRARRTIRTRTARSV